MFTTIFNLSKINCHLRMISALCSSRLICICLPPNDKAISAMCSMLKNVPFFKYQATLIVSLSVNIFLVKEIYIKNNKYNKYLQYIQRIFFFFSFCYIYLCKYILIYICHFETIMGRMIVKYFGQSFCCYLFYLCYYAGIKQEQEHISFMQLSYSCNISPGFNL